MLKQWVKSYQSAKALKKYLKNAGKSNYNAKDIKKIVDKL